MVSTTKRYGIIVGIDGSPESDAAVSWAAHDAAIRGLPLTVVHVESPAAATWSQAPALEQSPEEQQAESRSLLAHASKIAQAQSPTPRRSTSPANCCLLLARCRRSSSNLTKPN